MAKSRCRPTYICIACKSQSIRAGWQLWKRGYCIRRAVFAKSRTLPTDVHGADCGRAGLIHYFTHIRASSFRNPAPLFTELARHERPMNSLSVVGGTLKNAANVDRVRARDKGAAGRGGARAARAYELLLLFYVRAPLHRLFR